MGNLFCISDDSKDEQAIEQDVLQRSDKQKAKQAPPAALSMPSSDVAVKAVRDDDIDIVMDDGDEEKEIDKQQQEFDNPISQTEDKGKGVKQVVVDPEDKMPNMGTMMANDPYVKDLIKRADKEEADRGDNNDDTTDNPDDMVLAFEGNKRRVSYVMNNVVPPKTTDLNDDDDEDEDDDEDVAVFQIPNYDNVAKTLNEQGQAVIKARLSKISPRAQLKPTIFE